jgi:phosphoribosylformylglycinamidine cyclo-ligase
MVILPDIYKYFNFNYSDFKLDNTYKSAGVDLEAGDETVSRIKGYAKSTFNKNVLSDIGLFGGFFKLNLKKFNDPVLVSSVDGVGTKLKVAFGMNLHDTVGQDLVNHCVNDIAVCGAEPLYFLDYLAFGKLNPDTAEQIVKGFSVACKQNGCALIGGETAEMPGLYSENEYDMSGTIVGIVEKSNIINGSKIKKGDILVGFASHGLHTNGYSLARKVLLSKYSLGDIPAGFNKSIGAELLSIHRSYLTLIRKIKAKVKIKGLSHITGGGIIGNTKRILPKGLRLNIDWNSWELPKIFKLIQETGNVSDEEMRSVFNLGIGLVAVISKKQVDNILKISISLKQKAIVIGEVI